MYKKHVKRVLDIVCAIAAMIIFWWLYAIIAVLVRKKLGSPVIFKQTRVGKDEKLFELYKFRSMTNERGECGNLLPNEKRLTPFGRKLRSSSLDEIPELFNVLKGDMSIIGPRPLTPDYLPYYNKFERQRHDVLPGITGLAQVRGRTTLNWDEKFFYDVEYSKSVSFISDIKIFMRTVKKVIRREDIVEAGQQGSFHIYRAQQWRETDSNKETL